MKRRIKLPVVLVLIAAAAAATGYLLHDQNAADSVDSRSKKEATRQRSSAIMDTAVDSSRKVHPHPQQMDKRSAALLSQVANLAKLAPKLHKITDEELSIAINRFGDVPEFYLAAFASRRDAKLLRQCLEQHPDSAAARYLLLGMLAYQRAAGSQEYTQELAKLKATKGFEFYGQIIDWLAAVRSGDTEALVRHSQQVFSGDAQLISPDYNSRLLTMLSEVCCVDAVSALQQSRHMQLQPRGIRDMFLAVPEHYNKLIEQNRSSEAHNLLASAVSMASAIPGDDLETNQGRLQLEYDLLSKVESSPETDSMFKPSLAEYRQQLEGELQQAKVWNERLAQAARDGDVTLVNSFVQRAATVGEAAAAQELLGQIP